MPKAPFDPCKIYPRDPARDEALAREVLRGKEKVDAIDYDRRRNVILTITRHPNLRRLAIEAGWVDKRWK